jgi:heat shock protein HslJ
MTIPSRENRRVFKGLLALTASALALASCSSGVTDPSQVEGGAWKLRSMLITGGSLFVPTEPTRYTVEFKSDGQVDVVADCNVCGGSYAVTGGTLDAGPLACTLAACPGPQGIQFAGIIDGSSSIQKTGDDLLQIQSSEGKLLLGR